MRRALQSMTHIVTHAHHTNLDLPTSVVFLMIHDKLLIACGQRVFLVSDLSAFGASPCYPRDVRVELIVRGETLGFVEDELPTEQSSSLFPSGQLKLNSFIRESE